MVLGLEISTSSIKCILVDAEIGIIKQDVTAIKPEIANIVSMDPEKLYNHLIEFIKGFIGGYEDVIEEIAIVTLWNSLLFLSHKDKNQPIGRVKTWADTSGNLASLETQLDESAYTGCPKHYKFTRWKLIKEEHRISVREGHCVGSLADYLYFRFTGKWVMSHMMASGSGLLNLSQKDWHLSALKLLGLDVAQLPALVNWQYKARIKSDFARTIGLSESVSVQVPNGDGGMNQYAESGLNIGVWSLSIGTSGALRCLSQNHNVPKGLWCHTFGEGYYIKGATISGAGNCVQWFLEKHNLDQDFLNEVEASLSNMVIGQQPYYLPFIYGEQSPGWVSQRNSGYSETSRECTTVDLYYSLIEGITFNLYQGYSLLKDEEGIPETILISGGVVRTQYWLQLIADVLGQPLVVSTMEHSSLIGGIMSCGDYSIKNEKTLIEIKPDINKHQLLMTRFQGYKDFYTNIVT